MIGQYVGPERQIGCAPAPKGLLTEGREGELRRVVHELWIDLGQVRKSHDPHSMLRVLKHIRELNKMGYIPLVIAKGRCTGAAEARFVGKPIGEPEAPPPKTVTEEWLRFQEIKRQIGELPEATQHQLLRELRMARKKKVEG